MALHNTFIAASTISPWRKAVTNQSDIVRSRYHPGDIDFLSRKHNFMVYALLGVSANLKQEMDEVGLCVSLLLFWHARLAPKSESQPASQSWVSRWKTEEHENTDNPLAILTSFWPPSLPPSCLPAHSPALCNCAAPKHLSSLYPLPFCLSFSSIPLSIFPQSSVLPNCQTGKVWRADSKRHADAWLHIHMVLKPARL